MRTEPSEVGVRVIGADHPEAVAVKAAGPSEPLTQALLRGSVIHFPDDRRKAFNGTYLKRRHGVLLRTRLDAEGGRYFWTVPLPTEAPEVEPESTPS